MNDVDLATGLHPLDEAKSNKEPGSGQATHILPPGWWIIIIIENMIKSPGWWLIIIEHMINLQSFRTHVFPLPWITKVSPVVAHISWSNVNGQQEIILHYEFDKWFLYWILHLPHPGHVSRNTLRLEMFSHQTQSARSPPAEHLPLDIQTFK